MAVNELPERIEIIHDLTSHAKVTSIEPDWDHAVKALSVDLGSWFGNRRKDCCMRALVGVIWRFKRDHLLALQMPPVFNCLAGFTSWTLLNPSCQLFHR